MSDEQISIDDAAGLLAGNEDTENGRQTHEQADELLAPPEETEVETQEVEAEEYDDHAEEAPVEAEESAEEEVEEDPVEIQPIDPPASWSADEKDAFRSLPHDKQIVIAHRERERTAEIRRNQNELAEQKKALDTERAALEQEREQYLQAIPKPTPPDEALLEEDPMEYLRQKSKYENALSEHQEAQKELHAKHVERQEQAQQQYSTWLQEEQSKLVEMIPEYADPQKGPALKEGIAEYALSSGFSKEQLAQASAGEVNLLYKAMQFDMGKQKAAKAKTAPVPKMQKPGTRKSKSELSAKAREDQIRKLTKTGSIEDALSLMSPN